eukprot:GHUV01029523.1.p1 GENE.GHUV01029523.1~~GHUV01029523.1.p1  ORF type:complete len:144 (+),score=31.28 GHUV01029523.1:242-673(+)
MTCSVARATNPHGPLLGLGERHRCSDVISGLEDNLKPTQPGSVARETIGVRPSMHRTSTAAFGSVQDSACLVQQHTEAFNNDIPAAVAQLTALRLLRVAPSGQASLCCTVPAGVAVVVKYFMLCLSARDDMDSGMGPSTCRQQ